MGSLRLNVIDILKWKGGNVDRKHTRKVPYKDTGRQQADYVIHQETSNSQQTMRSYSRDMEKASSQLSE